MPLPELPELGTPSHILSWLRNETTEDWGVIHQDTVFCRFVEFLHPEAENGVTMLRDGFWLVPTVQGYSIPTWVGGARITLRMALAMKGREGREPRLTRDEVLFILKDYADGFQTKTHPDL